jgi:hypothetical protein
VLNDARTGTSSVRGQISMIGGPSSRHHVNGLPERDRPGTTRALMIFTW